MICNHILSDDILPPSSSLPPLSLQILSRALLESHEEASKAGQRLALEVFIAGRNRLENDGAAALSEVFEVGYYEDSITFYAT